MDEKTRKVVEMYSQYPYPFIGCHNNMFRDVVSPIVQKIGGISKILEAGCGTGNVAIEMATLLPDVQITAIDLTEKSLRIGIEKAKDLGIQDLIFKQSNLIEYDENLGVFDFVHCQGVIHHLSDPTLGMENINRYLKVGGYAYIWLYMLLGKRWILEIREALEILGANDMELNEKIKLTKLVIKCFRQNRVSSRRHDDMPLNSNVLRNLESAIRLLNNSGPKKFIKTFFRRFNFIKFKKHINSEGINETNIGLADSYIHPNDIFYRIEDIFKMFTQSGFSIERILDGMSNNIAQSLYRHDEIIKLANNLPKEKQYQLIELFEKPSGVGFLIKKN